MSWLVKRSASTPLFVPVGIDGQEADVKAGGGRHGDVAPADASGSRLLTLAENNVASDKRLKKEKDDEILAARRRGMNIESISSLK